MYLCGLTLPVYNTSDIPEKKHLVRGALIVGGSVYLVRRLLARVRSNRNKQKVVNKRREIQARKKELENSLLVDDTLLTGDREKVVSLHVEALLEQLRLGQLCPLQVLEAYQAKALTVDKDINAVCDFILEARDWAESLAEIPEDKRGPLFGLPISIKECFQVKGYDNTAGLSKYIGQPAEDDCEFVRCLKELHAVPFCLTNIPQTMVSYSCSNPVYGNTANPHLLERTPGGSSGGEGALIGAGGSILGLGSDVGGSLRIPAHFSGVCGLKPTNRRLFESGRRLGVGPDSKVTRCEIECSNGFMSSSVTGLEVAMRAVLQQAEKMAEVDWRVVPLVWKEVARPDRKLRIGYYTDDGVFPPTPGITRAVDEVVDLLSKAGHELVQWTPPGLGELMETFIHLMLADKGQHVLKTMEDEVTDQSIEVNMMSFRCPRMLKALIACVCDWVSPKTATILRATLHSRDSWVDNGLKNSLTYQMMAEWQQQEFDVVLCPAFAMPAPAPQHCSRLLYATSYTCVYNLVGCPAGIVPVTTETAEDQAKLAQYPVAGDACHRLVKHATKGAEGCPIGVQVVGRHFQDELVLHAMHLIEDLVNL